jgi:uncharacterized protein
MVQNQTEQPFWKIKELSEMTLEEWESLCDGCARCCLHKLEDEDTGEVFYTNVACRLLDEITCRCTNYASRSRLVPTCLVLDADLARQLSWLPPTCAYRLLAEGKDLEWWHPLVSGDRHIIHELGISVRGSIISENEIDMEQLEDYIIEIDDMD